MGRLTNLVGKGLYSVPDAARLIGSSPQEVRRWLYGYKTRSKGVVSYEAPPLWKRQLSEIGVDAVGFSDLLELRLVKAFRLHKVSLQAIRAASAYARESFGIEFPFTCRRFLTDGRSVFAYVLEETGDESLVDMVKRQNVFTNVVESSLYAGIDFSESGNALRWYPMERNRHVVLDPEVSFGSPILTDSGIPTATIAASYKAELMDAGTVASIFEISKREVEYAVRYEHSLVS
jgi:uncharacterized protein (DUF433 family)